MATIHIDGHDFDVRSWPAAEAGADLGKIIYHMNIIKISDDQPLSRKIETLFHEILHQINANRGYPLGPNGDEQENKIDAIVSGLVQVLRDNDLLNIENLPLEK